MRAIAVIVGLQIAKALERCKCDLPVAWVGSVPFVDEAQDLVVGCSHSVRKVVVRHELATVYLCNDDDNPFRSTQSVFSHANEASG
jgi:hypothetical protein